MSEAMELAEVFELEQDPESLYRRAAAELRRLHAENEALRAAYWKMRNAAAGFSNYCEDSASVRRCERDMEQAESMYQHAHKESI